MPLHSSIVFGHTHSYWTDKSDSIFIQPNRCQLSFTQVFRYKTNITYWWIVLSEEMVMAKDFSNDLLLYLVNHYDCNILYSGFLTWSYIFVNY